MTPTKNKATEKRHKCAVCGSQKQSTFFPTTIDGDRTHLTCIQCLQSNIHPGDWQSLGLLKPGRQPLNQDDVTNGTLPLILEQGMETQAGPSDTTSADDQPGQDALTQEMPERKRKRKRKGGDPWTKRKRSKVVTPRPPPKALTCRICAEEKEPTEFLKWVTPRMRLNSPMKIPYACVKHLCRNPRTRNDPVCISCIGATMAAAIDNGLAERLSHGCLEVGCTTTWDLNFILAFLPTEKLEEYNQQMFQVYLHEAKTFTCPLPSCGATGLLDRFHTPGFPHVECAACKTRICALCAVPWHTDLSCQAYRAANASSLMSAEEKKTLRELQKRGAKRCPRCQLAIVKDGGCDHMYCQHCGKYFAWSTAELVVGVSKAKAKGKAKVESQNQGANPYSEICELDAATAPPPLPPPLPHMGGAPQVLNLNALARLPPPPPPAAFRYPVPPELW